MESPNWFSTKFGIVFLMAELEIRNTKFT